MSRVKYDDSYEDVDDSAEISNFSTCTEGSEHEVDNPIDQSLIYQTACDIIAPIGRLDDGDDSDNSVAHSKAKRISKNMLKKGHRLSLNNSLVQKAKRQVMAIDPYHEHHPTNEDNETENQEYTVFPRTKNELSPDKDDVNYISHGSGKQFRELVFEDDDNYCSSEDQQPSRSDLHKGKRREERRDDRHWNSSGHAKSNGEHVIGVDNNRPLSHTEYDCNRGGIHDNGRVSRYASDVPERDLYREERYRQDHIVHYERDPRRRGDVLHGREIRQQRDPMYERQLRRLMYEKDMYLQGRGMMYERDMYQHGREIYYESDMYQHGRDRGRGMVNDDCERYYPAMDIIHDGSERYYQAGDMMYDGSERSYQGRDIMYDRRERYHQGRDMMYDEGEGFHMSYETERDIRERYERKRDAMYEREMKHRRERYDPHLAQNDKKRMHENDLKNNQENILFEKDMNKQHTHRKSNSNNHLKYENNINKKDFDEKDDQSHIIQNGKENKNTCVHPQEMRGQKSKVPLLGQLDNYDGPAKRDSNLSEGLVQTQIKEEEDFFTRAMREQEAEQLKDIQKDMHQVNEIYKEIAGLIEGQQENIDTFKENVEYAKSNVEAGLENILCANMNLMTVFEDVEDGIEEKKQKPKKIDVADKKNQKKEASGDVISVGDGVELRVKKASEEDNFMHEIAKSFDTFQEDLKSATEGMKRLGEDVVQYATYEIGLADQFKSAM